MLVNHKLSIYFFFLTTFWYDVVEAGNQRHGKGFRRRAASVQGVDVEGLNLLERYVCPPVSNSVKRQGTSSAALPVSVPTSDLPQIYKVLKSIEAQYPIASLQRRSDEVTLEVPGLDVLMTYVCSNESNMIKRQSFSPTTITISLGDLPQFSQVIIVLIEQVFSLIPAQSISAVVSSSVNVVTSAATDFTSVKFVTVTIAATTGYSTATISALFTNSSFPSNQTFSTNTSTPFTYTLPVSGVTSSSQSANESDVCYPNTSGLETVILSSTTITVSTTTITVMESAASTSASFSQVSLATSTASSLATSTTSSLASSTTSSLASSSTSSLISSTTSSTTSSLTSSTTSSLTSSTTSSLTSSTTSSLTSSTTSSLTSSTTSSRASSVHAATSLLIDPFVNAVRASSTSAVSSSSISNNLFTLKADPIRVITGVGGHLAGTSSSASSTTTTAITATDTTTYGPSGNSSGSAFNVEADTNIVVYFGQTAATSADPLITLCEDPDIDVVVLAFVIARNYSGGVYPQINFGAACGGQTALMEAEAPGLLQCTQLASYISTCQSSYGKKVMVSLGGATSQISFSSSADANEFGTVLWQLFGPPGQIDGSLRPFGNVTVDGFDIDSEDQLPAYFEDLGRTLRDAYETDISKPYYLSSAPQCPYPDASNPVGLLVLCDFVFVQFYNNPPCEIGSAGFNTSLQQWSTLLETSTLNPTPRLYLGAPAFSLAGPAAYSHISNAAGMQTVARETLNLGLENFGGVMFWDGPEGLENLENGVSIIKYAKDGLTT